MDERFEDSGAADRRRLAHVDTPYVDPEFWERPDVSRALAAWVEAALVEDRAREDVTSRTLLGDREGLAVATTTAEEPGVLCGGSAATAVFRALDPEVEVRAERLDGVRVERGDVVHVVCGCAVSLLAGERTALNILGHLSGIATRTAEWVQRAGDTIVLDTRKTFPGARLFQRRAVVAGGGTNHRFDLAEFPLVKENHRSLYGAGGSDDIPAIIDRLREATPEGPIEVEVEDENSFRAALVAGADRILLDNQTPETIAAWIEAAREVGLDPRPDALEASGGITGDTIAAYAASGVGRVSLGALTHSVRALDLSLHVAWA